MGITAAAVLCPQTETFLTFLIIEARRANHQPFENLTISEEKQSTSQLTRGIALSVTSLTTEKRMLILYLIGSNITSQTEIVQRQNQQQSIRMIALVLHWRRHHTNLHFDLGSSVPTLKTLLIIRQGMR